MACENDLEMATSSDGTRSVGTSGKLDWSNRAADDLCIDCNDRYWHNQNTKERLSDN